MKYAPMRFCGLSLSHNPHKLKIESDSNIRELMPPCCEPDSVYLGLRRAVISGEGEIYGPDCMERYSQLEAFHRAHTPGMLTVPHRQPVYAYLKELELTAGPVGDVIGYRFVFTQAQSPRKESESPVYYSVRYPRESLWDIAYAFDTEVEKLIGLNPDIPYIDNIEYGSRVRIC